MIPSRRFDVTLREGDEAHFHREGLVTIPRLTTDEEASWFCGVYDRILANRLEARRCRPNGAEPLINNTLWVSLDRWETLVLSRTNIVVNCGR